MGERLDLDDADSSAYVVFGSLLGCGMQGAHAWAVGKTEKIWPA